tara:strand:+ start:765 stop:1538 length:774 start_codon:yes stop_codon:yes gene_type:complete
MSSGIKIFSYLPNPRVWKSLIAANFCGAKVEVVGDEPKNLPNWLWDYDARELTEDDKSNSALIRKGRRGFTNDLFKTNEFLLAHPFGTVPAAFDLETKAGIFESNSIMRAVARSGKSNKLYGGDDLVLASRIDSYLDVNLVFSREHQVYILSVEKMNEVLYNRMKSAYEFYLDGIESALKLNKYIVGNFISLADISFVCDVGYFLKEANQKDVLDAQGFDLISNKFKNEYPQCADHLIELSNQEEFSTVIKDGFISL